MKRSSTPGAQRPLAASVFRACAAGGAFVVVATLFAVATGSEQQHPAVSEAPSAPPGEVAHVEFSPHATGHTITPCKLPFPNKDCQMIPSRRLKDKRPAQWLGCPDIGRQWDAQARVFPISFSAPAEMLVDSIPAKDKDSPDMVPGGQGSSSHRFADSPEGEYFQEYQRSRYCLTYKKAGFDAMRHYEIIFNGCMPFFLDLEYSHQYTITHLPMALLKEARDLPGVEFNCTSLRVEIDHSVFPVQRYESLLRALLRHAREHLTTAAMARYALRVSGNGGAKKVLWLRGRGDRMLPYMWWGGYLDHLMLHGFRSLLGSNLVDTDNDMHDFLYQPREDCCNRSTLAFWSHFKGLYGKGFTYAGRLNRSVPVDRSDIDARLRRREFDVVVLPVHRGHLARKRVGKQLMTVSQLPSLVSRLHSYGYKREQILYLVGEDAANPLDYIDTSSQRGTTMMVREIADCTRKRPAGTRGEKLRECVARTVPRAEADWREQRPFSEMRWLLK